MKFRFGFKSKPIRGRRGEEDSNTEAQRVKKTFRFKGPESLTSRFPDLAMKRNRFTQENRGPKRAIIRTREKREERRKPKGPSRGRGWGGRGGGKRRITIILLLKNRGFYAGSADISSGKGIRKKLAMLEHHPGNL